MGNESNPIVDKAYESMIKDMKGRNIVTEREFSKFLPLFDHAIRIDNTINQDRIAALLDEYNERFIPTLPIIVTTNDGKNIIEERSPMFIQVPSLNRHVKKSGELISEFDNIMSNPNQPIQKKVEISDILHKAMAISIKQDANYQKSKERAEAITEKHDSKNAPKEQETNTSGSITEGMKWE